MPARCTGCDIDTLNGLIYLHRAVEFPSVTLCSTCIQQFFGWLYDAGVIKGNPLVAAFWYGPHTIAIQSQEHGFIRPSIGGFKLVLKEST